MNKLTAKDLQFYKLYNEYYCRVLMKERYNIDYQKDFDIYDVVKIDDNLCVDKGYSGQYGIVVGVEPYVMAYNAKNDRYWVSGFNKSKLQKTNMVAESTGELYSKTIDYLLRNSFNLSTESFKKALNMYKSGFSFNDSIGISTVQKIKNNVIYVNF